MYSYLKKKNKTFSFDKKQKTVSTTVTVCFLLSKTTKSRGHMTSTPPVVDSTQLRVEDPVQSW